MRAFAAAAVLAQLVAAAVDLASIPRESSSNIVPGVYIVELSTGSHLKRGFQSPHEELYHDLARRGALWEVTREFSCDILTGATLRLGSEADLLKLAQSDGVQSIFPVYSHPMPEPINPYIPTGPEDPRCHPKDTLSTHLMTGVDKLHAEGILGQGIKIGIIDTGIDYTHPALGGKFGPGNKVIGGYDFVGDAYRGSSGPAPVPDNDPLDQCNGHGTHVAGILGANPDNPYNISGVAYKSSLNAYRIFGCSGSASDDLIVAALMRAWQDGNDVITLSLGIPDGWTTGMTGVVASRIADKGKIVVATAGNDGAYGSWYPNSPGAGLNVISVGSVNNVIINIQNATLSNGRTIPYYSFLPLPFPSNLPMYATSDITATADACKPLPDTTPDLSKYLVVVRRGGCALVDKFANVVAKGGRYFLLYDNIVEPLGAFDFGNYTTAGISKEDGEYLVQQAIPANVTISFFNTPFDYPLATGGLMSSFSSYSPTYDMYLKPAVAAPGGEILSTYPVKLGAYKIDSGTSMAAPFVAGSAALLLQVRGKTASVAKSAKSLFESTALPVRVSAGNASLFETAAHQGAGLIQVYDAIKNQGSMSPAELLLNDTASFKRSHTVTIRNNGRKSVTYDLTHVPAGTANTISGITARTTVSLISNAATVSISPSKLTVWPGASATFTAKFTAPTGLNATSFPVYSGFIKATGSDGSSFHSTYLGLAAPIKSMRIVDNTTAYFGTKLPLIQGNNSKPINDTTVFTMNGTDYPMMVYRLVAGSPKVQIDLIKSTTKVTPNLRKKRFTPLPQLGQSIPTDHHAVHLRPVELPVEKRSIWDWLMPYKGSTYGGSFASIPIVGTIYQRDYQGRNSPASTTGANGYESIKVDKFANGTAIPNGNYKILLRALKITGNPRNQEDYEVWTSPELQIKRT